MLLKSDRKSHHIGLLWFGAVVRLDGLMYTVTVISITLATLTAYSYRIGKVRSNMVGASWYFYSLVHELSICTNILRQSIFGEKQLAVDILRKEQKKECDRILKYIWIMETNTN